MDELKRLTYLLCRSKNHTSGKKQDPVTRGDSHCVFSNFSLFLKLNNSLLLKRSMNSVFLSVKCF